MASPLGEVVMFGFEPVFKPCLAFFEEAVFAARSVRQGIQTLSGMKADSRADAGSQWIAQHHNSRHSGELMAQPMMHVDQHPMAGRRFGISLVDPAACASYDQ